ncbi:MAG: TetR/AcrR family transcriptional regulator [Alphaproteobacteria bacterium]|nr:TetR/AcrR family transcriptional regulator [Alphaproteobacteria bacterium]
MSALVRRPASDAPAPRRILDAAATVFARYGYRRASMDAVAAGAGLSRQGLYRHFAAKDLLFAAVVEDMNRGAETAAVEAAAAARAAGKDAAAVLAALIGSRHAFYAERVMGSPHAAELMEESHRLSAGIVHRGLCDFREALVAAVETETGRRALKLKRGTSAADLADLLILATQGVKYATPAPSAAEMRALVDRLTQVIVAGVSA